MANGSIINRQTGLSIGLVALVIVPLFVYARNIDRTFSSLDATVSAMAKDIRGIAVKQEETVALATMRSWILLLRSENRGDGLVVPDLPE